MRYVRKSDLYKMISDLRHYWGLHDDSYNINVIKLCIEHGIKVATVPFNTAGLRGMASIGNESTPDVIILNAHRNKVEQNIDCAHESIHLAFHRNEDSKSFNCFETALPNQNKYLEWQANEGGAELLVPYRTLLPIIKKYHYCLNTYLDIYMLREELTHKYNVTEAVIKYRLESLKFEIEQYVNGVPIRDLRILSYSSQLKQKIKIKSLNELAMDDLSKNFKTKYCNICQNTEVSPNDIFCSICGNATLQWGVGKMKYPVKIKVNENSKALCCPICNNEELPTEGNHCPICGIELVNQCTNVDSYGYGCGALAAGNARYCIYCGAETTFFHNGFLKPWTEEVNTTMLKEDFKLIKHNWEGILQELGGVIRPCFRDTMLESNGKDCVTIVFYNPENYNIGRRPSILNEIEKHIKVHYGKEIFLKTRLENENEQLNPLQDKLFSEDEIHYFNVLGDIE